MDKTWPAAEIERRNASSLKPYKNNARTHSDAQIDQIVASMKEWGWTQPILVDEKDGIIAGHGRLMAAKKLGVEEVPVIVARGWSKTQKRAYALADNQIALNSDWDIDMLKVEVGALWDDYDTSLLGFSDDFLADLMASPTEGLTDPDAVPEEPETPVTVQGDLWVCGNHRILCSDTTLPESIALATGGRLIDLIVTSPPYNQKIDGFKPSGMHKEHGWVKKVGEKAYSDSMPEREYQESQSAILALWIDYMREGASLFYNHKNRYRDKRVVSPLQWLPGPFALRQEIIWSRPGSVTQNARMFMPSDERIYWLYKGDDFTFNDDTEIKSWSLVWSIAPKANTDHAVAFPIDIPERCIRASSMPDDLVFDPYCGSGTTIIASEKTGRHGAGIEQSPAYVDVIVKRWQEFTGQAATLESDGRTFAEIQNERTPKAQGKT